MLLSWRKQREFSSPPHEGGIAGPVAPFQGHGVPVLPDHDAFPPAIAIIFGQHHTADADLVPILR